MTSCAVLYTALACGAASDDAEDPRCVCRWTLVAQPSRGWGEGATYGTRSVASRATPLAACSCAQKPARPATVWLYREQPPPLPAASVADDNPIPTDARRRKPTPGGRWGMAEDPGGGGSRGGRSDGGFD